MAWGESTAQRIARRERQRPLYPELETADEGTIGKVDQIRREEGRPLTSFGQAAEDAYVRMGAEQIDDAPNRSDYTPGPLGSAISAAERPWWADAPRDLGSARARASTDVAPSLTDPLAQRVLSGPMGSFASLAPDTAHPIVQELARPSNYVGGSLGGVARGVGASVVGRLAGDKAYEALEGAPEPLRVGGSLAAGLLGGAGAVGAIGGARRGLSALDDFLGDAPAATPRRSPALAASIVPGLGPDDVKRIQDKIAREGMTPENRALIDEAMGRLFQNDPNVTPSKPVGAYDVTVNLRRAREIDARAEARAKELGLHAADETPDPFARFETPGRADAARRSEIAPERLEQIRREARAKAMGLSEQPPQGDVLGARIIPPNPIPTIKQAFAGKQRAPAVDSQMSFAGMEPPKVADSVLKRTLSLVADIGGVPRSLQSSFDLSGSLRQAGFLGARHRAQWKNAMAAQLKALVSEDNAKEIQWDIDHGEMARYRAGTSLYQAKWDGSDIGQREEAFVSATAGKLVGVKQTSRAYAVMLNKFRADVFDSIVSKWDDVDRTPQRLESLAKYVNAATGRGNLSGSMEEWAPALNALFFSPRFLVSIPQRHLALFTKDAMVRNEVAKDLATFYGVGLTLLGTVYAANEAGLINAKIETDFNDSDWGKVQIGNTRFDIWGGQQQFARMMARVVSNAPDYAKAYAKGGVSDLKKSENPIEILRQFLRYKFSPIANLEEQLRTGKTAIGEEAPGPIETAVRLVTPLFFQELFDAYQIGGVEAAAMTLPSGAGIGVNTFEERKKAPTRRNPARPQRPTRPQRPQPARPR